tara:strand:- start:3603 stop:4055 length:453 start_codon:yes stop_codon:yes gene_type:complete
MLDTINKELEGKKLPPNANKIFDIIKKCDELSLNVSKLYTKLSFETIGAIILGETDISKYDSMVETLDDYSNQYDRELSSEMKLVEDNYDTYEDFFHVIDNNTSDIISWRKISSLSDLTRKLVDLTSEDHDKFMRQANKDSEINNFKRFS